MAVNEKFNVENNIIITAKDEINVQEVQDHLKKNLNNFREGTQFIVLCGVHSVRNGELGENEFKSVSDFHAMFEWFHEDGTTSQVIKDRKYLMGTVLAVFTKKKENSNKYVLYESSKDALRIQFNSALSNRLPIVLTVASCWSYKGEISNILRSNGLLTVMNVKEELGKIGGMLVLDPEQKKFIQTICNCNGIIVKDIILVGHYGTGKTMLATEAVKILRAKLELNPDSSVDVFILSYDSNLEPLRTDLEKIWFHEYDYKRDSLKFFFFHDFLADFAKREELSLDEKQKILLSKDPKTILYIIVAESLRDSRLIHMYLLPLLLVLLINILIVAPFLAFNISN